ncbi:MAG: tetratricopeptide repeat protein [Spirochaetes bacterium]|nr:tetratricopeptide repeat protein [Spirochaetota bacterium]
MRKRVLILMVALMLVAPFYRASAQSDLLRKLSDGLKKEQEGDYITAIYIYHGILRENSYFLDAKIALARAYRKTGNLHESETLLREALLQDERSVETMNLLGRVLISLGKLDEAEQIFARALALKPVNIETQYGIADLKREQGDYDGAIAIYNGLLKIYPQDVWTYIHLGTAYTQIGEMRKAGGFFRKAVSLDSTSPWTHINLARHYYMMGILAAQNGERPLDKSLGAPYLDAAIFEAETAKTIDGSVADSYDILSSVYFYTGEYGEALKYYGRMIEDAQNRFSSSSGASLAIKLYETGFCYEMLRRYEDAAEQYKKALEKRIDDDVARFRLENLVLSMRRESLSDPYRVELSNEQLALARALSEKFIMDKAFFHYKRAVRLDPLDPNKRLELAEHYRTRGLFELYLHELRDIVRDTLDIDTVDLNDRIEIYENRVSKNLAARWKVSQYGLDESDRGYVPKTTVRIAVFDAFGHRMVPTEDVIHKRLSKTISEMLFFMLGYYPKIETVYYEGMIGAPEEALKAARKLEVDYYVTGTVTEKEDSLELTAYLNSGFNGRTVHSVTTYYTGNEKLFNCVFSVAKEIDGAVGLRGLIVRLSGSRALINLGSVHGVEKEMMFLIFRERGLTRDPETGEYSYDPDISLGRLTVTSTDETVSEGTYEFFGLHNRVNVYDSVVLTEEKK